MNIQQIRSTRQFISVALYLHAFCLSVPFCTEAKVAAAARVNIGVAEVRQFGRLAGQQPDPAPMGTPRRRQVKASDLGLSTSRYINMIPHIITVVTIIHFHNISNYFILRAYHLILLFICV